MVSILQSLAPGLLVAAPSLRDPNFDHTVLLMCVHNAEGAMGLVINRPAPVSLADILRQMEIDVDAKNNKSAMVGGPVAVENGLLLYQADAASETREDELRVSEQLRLCPNQAVLRAISRGRDPTQYHVFLGHSGWGPGQLEGEISQGAWIPTKLRLELIFDTPIEQRWEQALIREGINPSQVGAFRPAN